MTVLPSSIVVGVDGSTNAVTAIDWAAAEASRRRLPLQLLHARSDSRRGMIGDRLVTPPGEAPEMATDDVPASLARARRQVERDWPEVDVSVRVVPLGAPYALVTASASADMVVVGARGRSAVGRFLLGSVSQHVTTHASCPTVVVKRTPGDTGLPVLVGVDEAAASHDALEVAVEEAVQRHVPLVAVHAWTAPPLLAHGIWATPPEVDPRTRELEEGVLAEAIAGWMTKYPELEVRERVVHGHPVDALLDESEHSQLVVVGSHGRGVFAGMLMGSVASEVVQHADCPIVVVPSQTGRRAS